MNLMKTIEAARKLARPYCVTNGGRFRLRDFDPEETGPFRSEDKPKAQQALHNGVQALAALQDMLYAHDQWGVLLLFQAMDAAGKDGAIKHVMSGVNPQGCQVASFKTPSAEELDHDFLWRCIRHLPERGRIGIFNRSYYEEVLIVRVHPEFLDRQKLPARESGKRFWERRFESIRGFERHLHGNGTIVRKFFLHVSRKEQKRRFLERIEQPEKNWKFSPADVAERAHWDRYMRAYEDMIRKTATPASPWYVIPADHKWYTRTVVAAAVVEALASLELSYPEASEQQRAGLAESREQLMAEKD
ncbi:polyphosphate kinase 2 family protein [Candidatus Poribacteria bacterium]|nr:polyphosphate kinase 2 family protein [Candidatus Poribacteria bacterium]